MPWVAVTDPNEIAAAHATAKSGGGLPKLKADYAMQADGSAAPIPGTPEALKAQQAVAARQAQLRGVANTANTANELIDKVGWNTSGPIGALLSHIPGTDAYDFNQRLQTVRTNAGFDKLQAMRDSSPTGGAVGQVSDAEEKMLQASIGSMDLGQSADQLAKNLAAVRTEYRRRAAAMGGHNMNPQGQEVDPATNLPVAAATQMPAQAARPAPRQMVGKKVVRFEDLP